MFNLVGDRRGKVFPDGIVVMTVRTYEFKKKRGNLK